MTPHPVSEPLLRRLGVVAHQAGDPRSIKERRAPCAQMGLRHRRGNTRMAPIARPRESILSPAAGHDTHGSGTVGAARATPQHRQVRRQGHVRPRGGRARILNKAVDGLQDMKVRRDHHTPLMRAKLLHVRRAEEEE